MCERGITEGGGEGGCNGDKEEGKYDLARREDRQRG